jgi:hypothetical protein
VRHWYVMHEILESKSWIAPLPGTALLHMPTAMCTPGNFSGAIDTGWVGKSMLTVGFTKVAGALVKGRGMAQCTTLMGTFTRGDGTTISVRAGAYFGDGMGPCTRDTGR